MKLNLQGLLPHGAKSLALRALRVSIAREKIILSSPERPDWHLTIHLGPKSETLDVHATTTAADGSSTRETLLALPHTAFGALFDCAQDHVKDMTREFLASVRPLRPGWARRRGLVFLHMGEAIHAGSLGDLTVPLPKRKAKLSTRRLLGALSMGDVDDALHEWPEGALIVHEPRRSGPPRRIGAAYRCSDAAGRPSLLWFRDRDLLRLGSAQSHIFEDLIAQARAGATEHGRRFAE